MKIFFENKNFDKIPAGSLRSNHPNAEKAIDYQLCEHIVKISIPVRPEFTAP
jgi:hypothetical protein